VALVVLEVLTAPALLLLALGGLFSGFCQDGSDCGHRVPAPPIVWIVAGVAVACVGGVYAATNPAIRADRAAGRPDAGSGLIRFSLIVLGVVVAAFVIALAAPWVSCECPG